MNKDKFHTIVLVIIVCTCFGAACGLFMLSREIKRRCTPYARWIPDQTMHTGALVTCETSHTLAVQTAMDGYTVICNCREP